MEESMSQSQNCPLDEEKAAIINGWYSFTNASSASGVPIIAPILKYLSRIVPDLYLEERESGLLKACIQEDEYSSRIEAYFEEFLFGENKDQGKAALMSLNKPRQVCGRVFGVGDPTYTCKDCAADPTCVFCNDCFRKSSHVNHRYRLHTSAGRGGYCDCGDIEAWKQDPCCSSHKDGSQYTADENILDSLPKDFLSKAQPLYSTILQYSVDMLCWTENEALPEDLWTNSLKEDCFTTMLFNDESHTYDEVINTLCRAVQCDRAVGLKFATIVDRQGRSLVYSGAKEKCQSVCGLVKTLTSRSGKHPLKCEVMHKDIVAHQMVAIRLLEWIYNLSSISDGLRRLLCVLSVHPIGERPESLLVQIFNVDTELWKVARASCHQLFMNLLLIDPYGKQEFSTSYVKRYKRIMIDFISDDHEHSISASAMSVQIFTVPSLAMRLISDYEVLRIVMETFYDHMKPAINIDGVLDCQNANTLPKNHLRRASYILHDLGYLLHHKPEEWTPVLRERFTSAFEIFLKIISAMHGMDSVVRKQNSHIEFEPNWESGFLLQFWIMPIIEDMLAWCTSDPTVLRTSVKKCVSVIASWKHKFTLKNNLEVEPGHITVNYDVGSMPVTVHGALTRFLAGLLTGCSKFGLTLQEVMRLEEVGAKGYLALMEFPLRALVLTAQVCARMWRRNGYSILNQVSYYQNVRCVSEMYDRDIVMLQVAAACIDPDHFFTALLDKYGLLDWIRLDFDESSLDESQVVNNSEVENESQAVPASSETILALGDEKDRQSRTIVISEEFLLTVLAVLGERHVIGVGEVSTHDVLEREVIHQLALEPASRSEIVKNLPCKDPDDDKNCNFEAQLNAVLENVADFKKPGLTGKGLYELKKEFMSECNQFFYHYSRSEQSKALEIRRKESKKKGSFVFRPAPPPPFCPPFVAVTRLFHCSKFSKLVAVILLRTLKGNSKITPETVIEQALHLIFLGLQEQKRENSNAEVSENNFFDVMTRTLGVIEGKMVTILSLLQELNSSKPKEEYSELVTQILEECSHLHSGNVTGKRKIDEDAEFEKERKARLAKEKREKIMAQMAAMQKAFMQSNTQFMDIKETDSAMEEEDFQPVAHEQVAVGPTRQFVRPKPERTTCILCQENQDVTAEGRSFVLAALVQRSKVLSCSRGKSLETVTDYNPLFPPQDLFTGIYVDSCGHAMHSDCWEEYFKIVSQMEGRHNFRFHHYQTINTTKKEYVCPLCAALCNTALPFLPSLAENVAERSDPVEVESALPLDDVLIAVHRNAVKQAEECFKQEADSSFSIASTFKLLRSIMQGSSGVSNDLRNMMKKFSQSIYVAGLHAEPDESSPRYVTMSWSCCSYFIQCVEAISREDGKGLFGNLSKQQLTCLGAVVRFAALVSSVSSAEVVKKHCTRLMSVFSPFDVSEVATPSILELNIFGVLVNFRFALPSLQGSEVSQGSEWLSGSRSDETVLRLGLLSSVIQFLMLASPDPQEEEKVEDMDTPEDDEGPARRVAWLWALVHSWIGLSTNEPVHRNPRRLYKELHNLCYRFLRCCAVFFHFLTDVPIPPALAGDQPADEDTQFQALCTYLSIPVDFTELFQDIKDGEQESPTVSLVKRWCHHSRVKELLQDSSDRSSIRLACQPNRLIPLPHDYSVLVNSASGFKCSCTGDASRSPALCLVCGQMLCSQSYCCQTTLDGKSVGSCTAHAHTCSDGVGVFLRIRECEIVLLFFTSKGCYVPPPYLDEYGETDHLFRRGNPLFLKVERYNNLQRMWLSHGLPNEIARRMELNPRWMSFDWSQM